MKILITGANGQLGTELQRVLHDMRAEIGPLPADYRDAEVVALDSDGLDITDENAVASELSKGYDLVVNAAAYTNVDGCESNGVAADAVNHLGPAHLARACEEHGAKFVQVSTDYVFPGNEEGERVETDPVKPISAYGRTKLAGEEAVKELCSRYFIVRTAWLYGYKGKNFAKTMIRLAKKFGKISVVADQFGNPTSANDLAYEILKLALTQEYGVYHCTNNGTCSWFDFACAVVDLAGIPCEKEPLTSVEYKQRFPQSADRPHFSSLKNAHLEVTIGDEMRPWEEAVKTYMERLPELGDAN